MRIKLLQDIKGQDKDGNEFIRSTVRFSRGTALLWKAGTEMEVSEASGKKMIDAGQAVEVKPEPAK